MTKRSGIAVFAIETIGLLRLDDGGLRLVTPEVIDPATYPRLEKRVAEAWDFVDGHHQIVREAFRHIHEAFGVPEDAVHLLSLTEEQADFPVPADEVY